MEVENNGTKFEWKQEIAKRTLVPHFKLLIKSV